MYITSDLFSGADSRIHGEDTHQSQRSHLMDSHQAGLGKRKRHDRESTPNKYKTPSGPLPTNISTHDRNISHHQHGSPFNRASSQPRTISYSNNQSNPGSFRPTSPGYIAATERRPVKQMKRIPPRCTLVKSTSHLMDIEPTLPFGGPITPHAANPISDLRSCHACQSAPKRKRDLENYLDCKRCDGRTCYICARQCYGGCGKAVCKKCIVEVGEEGDPWCLDCYAHSINK